MMWCIDRTSTCRCCDSFSSRAKNSGPSPRSKDRRLSWSTMSRTASSSSIPVQSMSWKSVTPVRRTTWRGSPSISRKTVRRAPCRSTSRANAAPSPGTFSGPSRRSAWISLYAVLPGWSCSRNQMRCCPAASGATASGPSGDAARDGSGSAVPAGAAASIRTAGTASEAGAGCFPSYRSRSRFSSRMLPRSRAAGTPKSTSAATSSAPASRSASTTGGALLDRSDQRTLVAVAPVGPLEDVVEVVLRHLVEVDGEPEAVGDVAEHRQRGAHVAAQRCERLAPGRLVVGVEVGVQQDDDPAGARVEAGLLAGARGRARCSRRAARCPASSGWSRCPGRAGPPGGRTRAGRRSLRTSAGRTARDAGRAARRRSCRCPPPGVPPHRATAGAPRPVARTSPHGGGRNGRGRRRSRPAASPVAQPMPDPAAGQRCRPSPTPPRPGPGRAAAGRRSPRSA